MTSDNKVIPLHHHNTIEIDDSRLQAMWKSHNRRQGLIYGALGLASVTGVLLGLAAIVWAVMSHQPTPQIKVDVQPPNVTVNVPKQPAPVVNITVPERPLRPIDPPPPVRADGAPPIVTEYVIFKDVDVGEDIHVQTGWQYHNSTDTVPYHQWCYASISATSRLPLGFNGQPSGSLATDARALNLPEAQARAWVKECQWYSLETQAAPSVNLNSVTSTTQYGAFYVTGIADGIPVNFQVDTGANGTKLDSKLQSQLGPLPVVGTTDFVLANDSKVHVTLYRLPMLCVGSMCAENLEVSFAGSGSLLGTDFLKATHATLAVKDGVMTLSAN